MRIHHPITSRNSRLRIFTWHVHGSYLFYLSQCGFDIYIPVKPEKGEGYYGRGETFPFGANVHEVDVSNVRSLEIDVIIFQTRKNFEEDQYDILTLEQRALPKVFLQHDPPYQHPTDNRHWVNDPEILVVHVTHFNKLMWDNNECPAIVIEHGVTVAPEAEYSGELEKGVVVINNLETRGRLLGYDIFQEVSEQLPIDLIGMGSESIGLGEVLHPQLPDFIKRYRFFFNPIRYTSLGLAICEAMMAGVPVVGLATTELATVIKNGENGFIHTDISYLKEKMKLLLGDMDLARSMGMRGRQTALEKFSIGRFRDDWTKALHEHVAAGRVKIPEL